MAENRFITREEEKATVEQQEQLLKSSQQEETEAPEQEEKEEEGGKKKRSKRGSNKRARTFMSVIGGTFLIREAFAKQFPFMVYVTVLLMIIITNTYIAEDTTRQIAATTKKLSDLHVEYVQLRSSIMQASKQSVLARKLGDSGIKESVDPLRRISYTNDETK